MKRLLSLSIAAVLLLSACSNNAPANNTNNVKTEEPAATATPQPVEELSEVTLKIMIPGDRPPDMDLVIAEAEKRMKDTVNAKLDIVFVPWSDLAQKTQVTLASGENMDIIFENVVYFPIVVLVVNHE